MTETPYEIRVGDSDFFDPAIVVTVTERHTYRFPDPDATCSAHGQQFCIRCARNPGTCATDSSSGCAMYSTTGMHWDTCPNRIR